MFNGRFSIDWVSLTPFKFTYDAIKGCGSHEVSTPKCESVAVLIKNIHFEKIKQWKPLIVNAPESHDEIMERCNTYLRLEFALDLLPL